MNTDQVSSKNNLEYILMYKMSQNHLEVFFCSVRSKAGYNNNRTAIQFKTVYKTLFTNIAVKGTNENCLELDVLLSLLYNSSSAKKTDGDDTNLHLFTIN